MKKIKRILIRIANLLVTDKTKILFWKTCVRWPFLADCYYTLTGGFRREHRAVLLGKLKHLEKMWVTQEGGNNYTLSRNTHRLEKGLIMRPRRDVFGRNYIEETVDVFISEKKTCQANCPPLLKWSEDVLTEYFSVTGDDPVLNRSRDKFEAFVANAKKEIQAEQFIPYQRDTSPLQVTIEGMEEIAWRRRSVRWYQDKKVPRELIDRAINVAKLSPSACNRQPFEFRVFDDKELINSLSTTPMGTTGFADNFPCFVVIVGDLKAYFNERDRHAIYVDGGLAAMTLQFALEAQGIGSCCINWPDVEHLEKRMDKILGLDPTLRPVMCMSLGYPDETGMVPYSMKKDLDVIRSYNRTC